MPTRDDRSAAQNARQAILDSLNRFWKPADLDTAPSTAQHLLAELVNQGSFATSAEACIGAASKPAGHGPATA